MTHQNKLLTENTQNGRNYTKSNWRFRSKI